MDKALILARRISGPESMTTGSSGIAELQFIIGFVGREIDAGIAAPNQSGHEFNPGLAV